jgi:hypothetical protein
MKTVDLSKVLEMLINEEHDEATGLLHEWFVERSKAVHEELMAEDNTLSQDIEDDQEAIESEEFYNEADEDSDAEGEEELDGDLDAGVDADADVDGDIDAPAADAPAEETIGDTIEDLEAVMARLKAEFAEITGDVDAGVDADADMAGDDMDADMDMDADVEPIEPAEENFAFESEEADEDAEEVTESEDDFADLEESWTLEPVKDPNLNGGKEIGADGAKVSVNDKSPLPNHKGEDRVGGKAVEIKAETHEGHEREPAPEVKARPLLKNQVKKATDGRTKVSKEGDKSATLNSKAGFGSDSPKSPIGAGAADLRGSDFKRK